MKQLELGWSTRSIGRARAERDAGISKSQNAAQRVEPEFGSAAGAFLLEYAIRHREFAAEDAVDAYNQSSMPQPHDDRAWGAVFMKLARIGEIRRSNVVVQRRKGHASITLLWEKT